jgi:hypothetical protein
MADPILTGQRAKAASFKKKSQRSATFSDDGNNSVRLEDDGFLHRDFVRSYFSGVVVKGLDGAASPKAMARLGNNIFPAYNTLRGSFRGFLKADLSAIANVPTYLSGTTATFPNGATTFSLTADAGNNRVIVVFLWHYAGYTTPTSMAWNGYNFTKVGTTTFTDDGSNTFDVWVAAIGDSGSNQTFNVTLTGGGRAGNNVAAYNAMVYSNVNQSTPYGDVEMGTSGGSSAAATPPTIGAAYGTIVIGATGSNPTITTSGINLRQNGTYVDGGDVEGITGTITPSVSRTGSGCAVGGVELIAIAGSETTDVLITSGIVDGFTGLTKDEDYYVDGTTGGIATTGTGDYVGRAINTTQIELKESYGEHFVIQYDGVTSFNIPVSAGEQLTVWFKGTDTTGGGTYQLRLNTVNKDQVQDGNESFPQTCAMMFTEQIKTTGLYTVDVTTFSGSLTKFIAQKH